MTKFHFCNFYVLTCQKGQLRGPFSKVRIVLLMKFFCFLKEFSEILLKPSLDIHVLLNILTYFDKGTSVIGTFSGKGTFLHYSLGAGRPFNLPKNIRTLKYAFFDAKPCGEQRLLKVFCPLWEGLTNGFEKKTIWVTK